MLKRVFITNLLIMLLANVLVKPIWVFGIDRVIQLKVGHTEYGLYTALLGLTVVFNILLDLGITSFNTREIAQDSHRIHFSLPNLFVAKLVLAVFYTLILLTISFLLGYQKREMELVVLLIISQMISSFVLFLRSHISANHDFKMDAWLSVMDKVLMILVFSIYFFFFSSKYPFHISYFIWLQIMAYLITACTALVFIIRKYARIRFDFFAWKEVRKFCFASLPYAALIFLMGIYMRGDAVILERMAGARETGLFAGGYRLLDISNTLGVLTAGILLSMFSRIIHIPEKVKDLLETSVHLLLPLSITITLFCFLESKSLMEWLYHEKSGELPVVFSFLMLSFPAYCLLYIYSTLLTAKGEISLLIRFAALGSVLSVALNAWLIPTYGAEGTAFVSMTVHWILCIFSIMAVSRYYPGSWKRVQWLRILLFIGFILATHLVLQQFSMPLLVMACCDGLAWVALIFLLGIFDRKKLLTYFQLATMNG